MQELISGTTILCHQCPLPVGTGQSAHLWSEVTGWVAITLLSLLFLGVAPVIVRVKLCENNAISFPSLHACSSLSLNVWENCPAVSGLQGLVIPAFIFPECFICFLVFFACFHERSLSPAFSHMAVPSGPRSFCFTPTVYVLYTTLFSVYHLRLSFLLPPSL